MPLRGKGRPAKPAPPQLTVQGGDMSTVMEQAAVDCVREAIGMFQLERDIATYVKTEFDKKYPGPWQCIVGKFFGSNITHDDNHFVYLHAAGMAVLLFRSCQPTGVTGVRQKEGSVTFEHGDGSAEPLSPVFIFEKAH